MANPEHLAILGKGVEVWNAWRISNMGVHPDLSEADLSRTDLRGAFFPATNLHNVNFIDSDLSGANFTGADLSGANLHKAGLIEAYFGSANLRRANLHKARLLESNLTSADLGETNFTGTDLRRANLMFASLFQTIFVDVDFREMLNLQTVRHLGPSEISISTIYKSKGNISHKFLRDAGVPENFITYMSSLTGKAFEYFSAFISYTEADDAISKRLYADLQAAGLRVWRWREDAKWGAPIEKNIDQAVRIYDKLIVICSEDSLKAPAVIDEIDRALQKEHQLMKAGKTPEVLFPITIDDYIFDEWEHYLKPKVIAKTVGDFRGWKDPKQYDKALERLIEALKQEDSNGN